MTITGAGMAVTTPLCRWSRDGAGEPSRGPRVEKPRASSTVVYLSSNTSPIALTMASHA
jgi:hypothetical protein